MKIAWFLLLALVLALAAALGLRFGTDRVLEARGVRVQISRAAANLLNADAGFLPLKWGGLAITSRGLIAQSPQDAFALRASGVRMRTNLAQFWRREWKIDKVNAAHLQIAFGADASAKLDPIATPEFFSPLPNEWALHEIDSGRTDLFLDLGELHDASAHFSSGVIEAEGGAFRYANLPSAQLQRLRLLVNQSSLRIEEAALSLGGESVVHAAGNLRPNADVDFSFTRCPLAPFLGASVEGEFEGHARLQKSPNEWPHLEGVIAVQRALLQKIESLQRAAQLAGRPELAELKIDNAQADFASDGANVSVKNFVLEAKALLTIRGELSIHDDRIDGEFDLGVAPELAEKFPGAREEIFQRSGEGYVWTKVTVNGKRDNLRPRLVRAARDHHADEKIIDALEDL